VATDTPVQTKLRFKRAPVIKRQINVLCKGKDGIFAARQQSYWEKISTSKWPTESRHEYELTCNLQQVPGELSVQLEKSISIIHCFRKIIGENGSDSLEFRFRENQFSLTLNSGPGSEVGFERLHQEFNFFVNDWTQHFDIESLLCVELEYVNLISKKTTPALISEDGSVNLGDALNIFTAREIGGAGVIPPYNCQMGILIDAETGRSFHMRVKGLEQLLDGASAVRVDFKASRQKTNIELTAIEVAEECAKLHLVVWNKFNAIFSDKAKASFDPIPID